MDGCNLTKNEKGLKIKIELIVVYTNKLNIKRNICCVEGTTILYMRTLVQGH